MQQQFYEIILNFFQVLPLLKTFLVLSYFSNLKSHLNISDQSFIKQYCDYNLVLMRYMTYCTFITPMFSDIVVPAL